MNIKIAFSSRHKSSNFGPHVFQERLIQALQAHPQVQIGSSRRHHNIHFINISGSGRRADQFKAKKILRVDGIYHDLSRLDEESNEGIQNTYHSADGIIFQCNFAREMLYHHFGPPQNAKHEAIIYNAADQSFSPQGERLPSNFDTILICSARWRPHKRLDSIVDTFKVYAEQNPNTGLIILGECDEKFDHPNIVHHNVEPKDLAKYYRTADAMLHFAYTDWCPNTVVEALACGVPVVTTHNGGTPELIGENGVIIKSDPDYDYQFIDFTALPKVNAELGAQAIQTALQMPDFNRPDLCIQHCAQRYVDFFEKVLSK